MRSSKVVIGSWLLGVSLLAAPALADIPPADACEEASVGKACDNAGEEGDQPGICKADTCERATPDGPMTYDCFTCEPSGEKKDDGGCAVSAVPAGGISGLLASLTAVTLLILRRRAAR